MAKTVFLNNHADIVLGYEIETTVVSASAIAGPSVKVYPAAIQTIAVNMLLNIAGVGDKTVTSVGSDGGGNYFTYAGSDVPAAGAAIKTPWNASGALLVTRAENSITLKYTAATQHDLYFATQKTNDSGKIVVKVDGVEAAGSPFDLYNASTILASVLVKEDVSNGEHTVKITASFPDPANDIFVYFNKIELLEHVRQTGGFYHHLGPAPASLETSTINFIGDWSTVGGYAYTPTIGASAFFYPQLGEDGAIKIRVQKTPDSGIVELYRDGQLVREFDLYAEPAVGPVDITLYIEPTEPAVEQMELELRNKDDKNPLSSGNVFYLRGTVVVFSRTDLQALTLAANYLRRVGEMRGDGAFLDSYDSERINFDSNALYASMGLLGAHEMIGDPSDPVYLTVVKNFLTWFAGMQESNPGVPFDDGHWKIGYRVNPADPPVPEYIPAIAPYDAQGITEIRWVDAVQCLPAFVLWWYWKLSGDTATRDALLPPFKKGIDGFITNNYDQQTGFFFSSWQYKTAPTIFLYHDAIRRYDSGDALLEQHDDADTGFFTYSPAVDWGSYGPPLAIGAGEHYSLIANSYVQFSLTLNAGDKVKWVTQTAWDVGIAEVLISDDGVDWTHLADLDGYAAAIHWQQEFLIYTASGSGTKYFRIRHSGTINPAGNAQLGWQRLNNRYAAGQTDVLLGLAAMYFLTRQTKYSNLAVKILQRFPDRFWSEADQRWYIALEGAAPGTGNNFWYPFPHGWTVIGQKWSRLFQPISLFELGLQALEQWFTLDDPVSGNLDGGIQPPGYSEPEHIFSAFYRMGENQLTIPTDAEKYDLAQEYIKGGQYFLTLQGTPVGGIVFSKRYPYLYTNIAGFACLALAGTVNPITQQLRILIGTTRMILPQYG